MMRRLPLVCLIAALGSSVAHAGVFDDDEARRKIADLQIKTEARFDQQARAQLELAGQIQRQLEEIARLRGQLETLTYETEQAKKRQQDFYLDLDSRLRKLEPQLNGDAAVDPGSEAKPAAADPAKESQAYDAALDLFKAQKYKESAAAFAALVEQYPNGTLAPNAQYWLGNAWFAQRNCTKAIEAQTMVTARYPKSDKAPDAWLSIATCQQELGNQAAAKKTLQTLIEKYPAAPAAEKARDRLKKK
ncbi:tol-pal system protein YbgF [Azonexus sp.]|uniref:tol-pal system protein YbgF n=1 Tax=Azonexus sp. TaxID=1872668 RepID=UPI0027B9D587|nr:tol-pal system protein YbgF [Azonexus sp.]